jgi:hypothetical protein
MLFGNPFRPLLVRGEVRAMSIGTEEPLVLGYG